LQGLSLKNVSLTIREISSGKTVYEDFGEMMFTHFGITGPMVLSASAHIPDLCPKKYEALINLKPALDEKTLDARILSDFTKYNNKDFGNALGDLLPAKMIPVILSLSGISPQKKVNSVTKEERGRLRELLQSLRIPLDGFRPIEEAIVTKGGVSVREINPKTMESKLCAGLFFAGEVLDVDAYTGGYNLQIAFSTGALAGASAASEV
jgi:predicted Rossmann fold flavoprotein